MVDRIGYTGILCHTLIGEVDLSVFVQSYVLQKGVALDGIVDIGSESLSRSITFA